MSANLSRGKKGEDAATEFLRKKGYKILERNFRTQFGEVDLIAREDNVLVFIEVKTRQSTKYGMPEESVTPRKIASIIRTGQYYKLTHPDTPDLIRIDVIAVELVRNSDVTIRHLKNVTE